MRRQQGFTLLELMIVVAVIAILATIALPTFSEYIRKGKRSEGAATIGDIQLREERYRADNPTYGSMTDLFGTAALATSFNSNKQYYSVSVASNTATGYIVTATRKGDLATDPKCGNLIMTYSAGTAAKSVSSGDSDYCWRQK